MKSKEVEKLNNSELSDFVLDKEIDIIVDASIRLKCSMATRSKALLIYHHFKRCVPETRYDPYLVAAACVSLSIKLNEEGTDFDAIILVFFCIVEQGVCRTTLDNRFKEMKQSVTKMECLILRMLEFTVNHVLAHGYLVHYLNDMQEEFKITGVLDILTETSMKIVSDFYLRNKCLDYNAEEIASTVLQQALYFVGLDVNNKCCHLKTWLENLDDCPESRRHLIIEDIFKICNIGPAVHGKQLGKA